MKTINSIWQIQVINTKISREILDTLLKTTPSWMTTSSIIKGVEFGNIRKTACCWNIKLVQRKPRSRNSATVTHYRGFVSIFASQKMQTHVRRFQQGLSSWSRERERERESKGTRLAESMQAARMIMEKLRRRKQTDERNGHTDKSGRDHRIVRYLNFPYCLVHRAL